VIRNDQHDGSSHQGKIFIVAGNRPAAAHLPRKATITFRNHSAHPDPAGPGSAPVSRSRPADFSGLARPECTTHLGATPTPDLSGYAAVGPGRPNVRRASAGRLVGSSHPPGVPSRSSAISGEGAQPVGRRPTPRAPSRLVDGLPNRREENLLLPSP
jgi:hypothetical protein